MKKIKSKVIATPVIDTKSNTIQPLMREHVLIGSTINTDEWYAYKGLDKDYNHNIVNHGNGEYVNGDTHTNTVENFWSLLKRGIIGIYHHVSPKHLDRYCDEFTYRYNTIDNTQEKRFDTAITQSKGKRLRYSELIKAK